MNTKEMIDCLEAWKPALIDEGWDNLEEQKFVAIIKALQHYETLLKLKVPKSGTLCK